MALTRHVAVAIALTATLAATGCAAAAPTDEPEATSQVEETTPDTAEEESEESSESSVETVALPEAWPAELPMPDCALVTAVDYGTTFTDPGGVIALEFACDDGGAEGEAVLDALRANYTATSDLGTSGFFEFGDLTIQYGYDDSEIKYSAIRN